MARDIEKEFKVLDDSAKNIEFVKKLITPQKYKAQIRETKADILRFTRKRLVSETRHAAILGSVESRKIATFLEKFLQGFTTEERYFFRISVIETPI